MNSTSHSHRDSASAASQSGSSFVQSFARQPVRPSASEPAVAVPSRPDNTHSNDATSPSTTSPRHVPAAEPWVAEPWSDSDDNDQVAIGEPGHSQPPESHLRAQDSPATESPTPDTQEIQPIIPAWEVDVFDVPTTVADLFFADKLFADLSVRMAEAVAGGLQSIMVTSTESGEGRSSVAIGMALAAASTGMKVALVDADVENPTLVDDLRLDVEFGWVESVRSGLPISEIAIHAIEDGVTLIPLLPASGNEAGAAETNQLIERLQNHFDMVIVDGPSSDSLPLYRVAPVVDSAIIVRDVTRISTDAINAFADRLRDSGVKGVGVVENFTC